MKTTSRLALAAAAGLVLGGMGAVPAKAADLGGNCCADLEERIAELEATTVRKGTRKLSLTLSGQVNRGVLWYDDGSISQARYGVDNNNSSSRFRLQGSAMIGHGWSAGYYMEFEFISSNTFGLDQIDERRAAPQNTIHLAQPNGQGSSPFSIGIRQSHWWLKNDRLGTVSVGHVNSATKDFAGIDLGGIAVIANSDLRVVGGELFTRRVGTVGREGLNAAGLGSVSTLRWTQLLTLGDNYRIDGVRYDSPTLHGFTLSAAIGDDVRWDVALRFEKDFGGVRVAAGVGYIKDLDEDFIAGEPFTAAGSSIATTFALKPGRREFEEVRVNASALHTHSGLFVNAAYHQRDFKGTFGPSDVIGGGAASPFLPLTVGASRPDIREWWVAGGLKRNWFGLGFTSLYGEYGRVEDGVTGLAFNFTPGPNIAQVTDSKVDIWGLGLVQNIDAAAMELYLGYRHFSASLEGGDSRTGIITQVPIEDLNVVLAGARIKF